MRPPPKSRGKQDRAGVETLGRAGFNEAPAEKQGKTWGTMDLLFDPFTLQ